MEIRTTTTMSNDKLPINPEEEIFVDRPKRNHNAKKGKGGGDAWKGKATKQYKKREQELYEESLDEDLDEY